MKKLKKKSLFKLDVCVQCPVANCYMSFLRTTSKSLFAKHWLGARQKLHWLVRRNFRRGIEDLITGRNPPVVPQTAIDKYFLGREFVVIIAACSP